MTKKFIILNSVGQVTGVDMSDLDYEMVPNGWVEVPLAYQLPTFPLFNNARTKHIWLYHFALSEWQKTDMIRTAAPGELLFDDDENDIHPLINNRVGTIFEL